GGGLAHLAFIRRARRVGGILAGDPARRASTGALPANRQGVAEGVGVAMTDLPDVLAGLDEADQALRHVFDLVATSSAADLTAPSALPTWTRGHVLAHLDGVARAYARQVQFAAEGETIEVYDGGAAGREANIAAGARRSRAEHLDALGAALTM